MTAIESGNANFFSTTLSNAITAADTSITLIGIGALTSPAYIVIDPNSDSKREVIYADGTWSGNTITLTTSNNRGLSGSAAGAQAHDANTLVVSVPLAQHLQDIHDRVDVHTHDGTTADSAVDHGDLTSLLTDDHTQYSRVDGTRAFTGEVAGITPTVDASLATKGYVDSVAVAVTDLATAATNSDVSLATSFKDALSTTYTPPASWGTYTLKARGFSSVKGVPGTDVIQARVMIDGTAGTAISTESGNNQAHTASKVSTGLSGVVTVALQVRNTTSATGNSDSASLDMIAVRTS